VTDRPQPGTGTRAVHAGEDQVTPRRPVVVPVYQTAPFVFDSATELNRAFGSGEVEALYSRYANPTVRVVEEKLAALEGAADAVAFASGMAAISSTLSTLLRSGDRLIAAADIYGGTHSWLAWLQEHNPEIAIERPPLAAMVERLEGETGEDGVRTVVFLETPTNPLLTCCDLERVGAACRRLGWTTVIDNTFATPVLQNPLALGADLVVHSATKYLSGHGDVTAGLVAGPAAALEPIRHTQIVGGACLDPHAAFLLSRGMKTLALRVERQSANAARLAAALGEHPAVKRVFYPGLDPIARRQMRSGGGMLSFELAGGDEAARLLDRLELVQIVPSLGDAETGAMLPATTSHRQLTPEQRRALGIGDGLVRLSCGIEDGADLEADLLRALA
jgi:cystathionine beta-lyase/cystathionine gamma-synthase